jgi:adenosylcobinamide-phosphate synthase
MALSSTSLMAASAVLALWLDHRWGEPPQALHPVVWMGHWLGRPGQRLSRLRPAWAFWGGALWWSLGAVTVASLALWAQQTLLGWAGQGGWEAVGAVVLGGVLLKPLLAWRMLRDEVQAVDLALAHSLPAGRTRLAWLVSREVHTLDAVEVREAVTSTLAENLNDSVLAPLFWWVVAGLPGAAVYRFANTADAMWGYRDHREWSGKWAARADDLLSGVPARLTALGLCAVAWAWPGWARLRQQARLTPSPNGGWPMGAMACLLGCRLGKRGVYTLVAEGRAISSADLQRALAWSGRLVGVLALLLAACCVQGLIP